MAMYFLLMWLSEPWPALSLSHAIFYWQARRRAGCRRARTSKNVTDPDSPEFVLRWLTTMPCVRCHAPIVTPLFVVRNWRRGYTAHCPYGCGQYEYFRDEGWIWCPYGCALRQG